MAAGSIDERAVPFRRDMVAGLAKLGVRDTVVLDVMAAVPRHWFVDRFWATAPGMPWTPEQVREFRVDDESDDETLALIYGVDTALMTRGRVDRARATSTLSAPIIVALMLAELDLRPGLRVLEIGTGSGYHAALMAALVGDPALVTTIDIDQTVISETLTRLDRLGYGAMSVRCGDGAAGVAVGAPFDRIVATVGCVDLSPHWVEQLAGPGQMLVPLEHGYVHPRVSVRRGPGLPGRFVGHSGFVRIQGEQGLTTRRPLPARPSGPSTAESAPAELLAALAPPDATRPMRAPATWDFAIYLAVRDGRAAAGPTLAEDDSVGGLQGAELVVGGARGAALKERFLEIAADWLRIGAPGIGRYTMTFTPLPLADEDPPADNPDGPWYIDRISYRETICLNAPISLPEGAKSPPA